MGAPEIWPPLLTPFDAGGGLDPAAIGPMVEFYVQAGCTGLLVNGLSAEPFMTSQEERATVLAEAARHAHGGLEIAAAVYPDGGDWPEAIAETQRAGADIAVLLLPLLADEAEDDGALLEALQRIAGQTDMPLGLYEAPRPYKRILSTEALRWAAQSGRFTFFKDTCQDLGRIRDRLRAVEGTPLRLLNAEVASFRASMASGARGFCGLMANVAPAALAQAAADGPEGAEIARLLTLADPALEKHYPASAKCLLAERYGLPLSSYARTLGRGTDLRLCNALDALYKLLDQRGLARRGRAEPACHID
jgi:4-hydroxy-tetrahydrodipicolinate synthase